MAKKPNVRRDIKDAKEALKQVYLEGLTQLSAGVIEQVMRKAKSLPASSKMNATKGIKWPGENAYRQAVKAALASVAAQALNQARKEVPKAKNVKLCESLNSIKLSDFDRLPPKIRNRIQQQSQLIVDTQMQDLEKAVFFQFGHSYDSTEDDALIEKDLRGSAEDYLGGASIEAGSGLAAAQMINEARSAFFMDSEVQDELDAFQFTNGDPVSEICQDLAGTIFAKDDPEAFRYWPPLHWNCKSYILPILSGDLGDRSIEDLKPSSSDLEDQVQFSEKARCGCGADHSPKLLTEMRGQLSMKE